MGTHSRTLGDTGLSAEVDYVIVDPPPDPEAMQFVETNPDVPHQRAG